MCNFGKIFQAKINSMLIQIRQLFFSPLPVLLFLSLSKCIEMKDKNWEKVWQSQGNTKKTFKSPSKSIQLKMLHFCLILKQHFSIHFLKWGKSMTENLKPFVTMIFFFFLQQLSPLFPAGPIKSFISLLITEQMQPLQMHSLVSHLRNVLWIQRRRQNFVRNERLMLVPEGLWAFWFSINQPSDARLWVRTIKIGDLQGKEERFWLD